MIHHIAMFKFQPEVDPAQVAAIRNDLLSLPETITAIGSYSVGRDARLKDGTWDMVVVASFADPADYHEYSAHPDHQAIVKRILEIAVDRASLQTSELG